MSEARRANDRHSELISLISETLEERELSYQRHGDNGFLVTLPGTARLQTPTWLILGEHSLRIGAFVCRRPDENHEGVYHFMLTRNARLYGVHYALDRLGDINLVGRIAHESVTADELDRVLGQVLEAADGDFNTLLKLGFADSIRREWAWRTDRGEPLDNLRAFAGLISD